MADEPIAFLIQVELPTFCYVSEAVEWIAIGRVPQVQWDYDRKSDEPIEHRFNWREMPDNFEPCIVYPWFNRSEFDLLGIPIVEDYFAAAHRCFNEFVNDLPERIRDYDSKEDIFFQNDDGVTVNLYKSLADGYRAELKELLPLQQVVDQVESQFWRFYEVFAASRHIASTLIACHYSSQGLHFAI